MLTTEQQRITKINLEQFEKTQQNFTRSIKATKITSQVNFKELDINQDYVYDYVI